MWGGIIAVHVITTTTNYSTVNVGDDDGVTVNAGGVMSLDSGWAGANGSIKTSHIIVNARGTHIQDAGTKHYLYDTRYQYTAEGGRYIVNGTLANPCFIQGETSGNTYNLYTSGGGIIHINHCTLKYLNTIGSNDGELDLNNITISDFNTMPIYVSGDACLVRITNSTVTSKAGVACLQASYNLFVEAINCTFANVGASGYLCHAGIMQRVEFVGCTYNGNAIDTTGIGVNSTQDSDIRIYEKATFTDSNSNDDAYVGLSHPSMDADGNVLDSTNSLMIPAYKQHGLTVSGVTTIYTLRKNMYRPSGGNWSQKYWSDSGQAETGDNQKWTGVMAKDGYSVGTDTDWSGTALTCTLSATGSPPVISNAALDDITITQDQDLEVTADGSNTPTNAFVKFYDPDDSVTLVHQQVMAIDGVDLSVTVLAGSLPVGSFSAGDIEIIATNANGSGTDKTLTLTVSESSASPQYQSALALRTLIRADARFDDIDDADIVIIPTLDHLEKLPNYPAIGIIPDDDDPEYFDGNNMLHKCVVHLVPVVNYELAMETFDDLTNTAQMQVWIKALNDLVRAQDDDPDKRLSGLAYELRPFRIEPRVSKGLYLGFVKVEIKVIGE